MPVKECQLNGKPGFKWGDVGHCYTYEPGSQMSMALAKEKAEEQGRAIEASQGKEHKPKRIYINDQKDKKR